MKLYKISQSVNNNWDTYDSAVVVAASEEDARLIHPYAKRAQELGLGRIRWVEADRRWDQWGQESWTDPVNVAVEYVGEAAPHLQPGYVVVASFNAG